MKKSLWILLFGLSLLIPYHSVKAETKNCATEEAIETTNNEVDWKTAIPMKADLDVLFGNEYEEAKTLYTTVYLNMRPVPNTNSKVKKVLAPNTEVAAIADYNGWTKIAVLNKETNKYNHYYLWNEYLTDEKKEQSGEYLGNFKLTAYCPCSSCCGKWAGGATASGVMPSAGRTIAMGGISFGTKLLINGNVYTVEDRGTPYGHVDIYFNSHSEALQFGLQYADVYKVN